MIDEVGQGLFCSPDKFTLTLFPHKAMGMFLHTCLRSQCQFDMFLYVILDVTSNVMMPFWPWMCCAGDVSHRGCVTQGMCLAGDVSCRGCVTQGMCHAGNVSCRGCSHTHV